MGALRAAFGFETEASVVFRAPVRTSADAAGAAVSDAVGWGLAPDTIDDPEGALGALARPVIKALRAQPAVAAVISPWGVRDPLTAGLAPHDAALVVRETRLVGDYGRWFLRDDGRVEARATVLLRTSDSDVATELGALVAKACPGASCYLAGAVVAFAEFTREVTGALVESLFVGLALAALVLAFLAHALDRRDAWPMALASLWGPLVTTGLLGLSPLRVNFVTSMLASVAVGLAGDNAIQFWFASRRSGRRRDGGIVAGNDSGAAHGLARRARPRCD